MKPWVMRMRWLDLLFAHWPVDPDVLAARLPAGLELDLRDGQAWLGIVPFTMAAASGLALPASGPHLRFAERLDVRAWAPQRA